jgi:LacI family transcriptional regulator
LSKRLQRSQALRRHAVTIVDVAAAAGVSISTVSRALAGSSRVNPELALRVHREAARLGYTPDRVARALVQRRSNAIGAVVPTVDNAIFARAIQALQSRLDAAGYRLLLATSEYAPARELAGVQALVEHGADGVVLVGAQHHPGVCPLLDTKGVPFVQLWTCDSSGGAATIGFDNREAMHRLVTHLVDLGHRRVAMIAGAVAGNDRAAARIAGLHDALAGRGLAPEAIVERAYTIQDGRNAARMLLDRDPRPTALVCGNDILAFGALAQARAQGIEVPGALSVTGFDDLDLATCVTPPLSTMRVPAAAMGELAAEHLLARIAGRETSHSIALAAELIVRGSTGPPGR